MAIDKLVDSSQLDANLTLIANAIRTKSGTSVNLSFPNDFITAINAISNGGGNEPSGLTETLLGQTPYTLTEDANIRLKSTSETTYSTGSGVIADFADRENVTLSNATLTNQGSYWELADTGATNWYESTMQFYITGLIPNTTYTARIGGMTDGETYCGGWWGIWDATSGDALAGNQFANEGTLEFTPTSSSIRVMAAPAGDYFWERNVKVCRFTNFSIESENSATFTGSVDLGQLASGTTITSTPSCDVYAVIESSGGGTLRGKTCVCLGDSVTGFMAPPTDYPSKLASNTGMTVYNCGFAGCRISDTHPTTAYRYFGLTHIADAIASGDWTDQDTYVSSIEADTYPQVHLNNLKNADWDNVDYITIFYGANDANNGVPLGDATGTNIQTVLGAFNHSITAIRTAYPNIHILVFAPEYVYFVSDNMGAETKNITVYGTSDTMKFYEWGDAIIQRAAALGVPAVDMYRTLGIDLSNWSTYLKNDGAHPNDAGTTLIAQKFETELYNHFILGGSSATLITKTITTNGTYSASDDSADGYSEVTVNVPTSSESTTWETLSNQNVTIVADNPNYIILTFTDPIGADETYRVTWGENGTQYICETYYDNTGTTYDGYVLGNRSLVGQYDDTEEPFLLYRDRTDRMVGVINQAAGQWHIKIEKQVPISSNLITKTITQNGTYSALSDSADGYSSVTVNVPISTPVTWETKSDQGITITSNGTYNYATWTYTEPLQADETYRITWGENGTQYICETVPISSGTYDGYYLGNASIVNLGENTGEPFILYRNNSTGMVVTTTQATGSWHIKVEKQVPTFSITREPIVPATTVSATTGSWARLTTGTTPSLVEGEYYAYIINGVERVATATRANNIIYLSDINYDWDNGGFAIGYDTQYGGIWFETLSTSGEYTVKVDKITFSDGDSSSEESVSG